MIKAAILATVTCLFAPLITTVVAQAPLPPGEVGIDEKLGQYVPSDLKFYDENGDSVRLGELINKPTILALVYYTCPGMCSPLLNGVAEVLEKLDEEPGKDYSVLTISFDTNDKPSLAAQKKINYVKSIKRPFPPAAWHFLTGDSLNIQRITDAVGFRYKRQGRDFIHPGLITVLAPDGKIARYLYGITFLPFDLKMALVEASEGRTGPTISKVLMYCYNYDPVGRKYALSIVRVGGLIILFFVAIFILYLLINSRVRHKMAR
jgi:protein SCO1/2